MADAACAGVGVDGASCGMAIDEACACAGVDGASWGVAACPGALLCKTSLDFLNYFKRCFWKSC